jgi:hypothetical protein
MPMTLDPARPEIPELLTVAEVADALRMSPQTVKRQAGHGLPHAYRVGGRWMFDARDIADLFA